jgi:vacuolar-type H+-ATPase subunit H
VISDTLDTIRDAEFEAARRIETARRAAEDELARARSTATRIVEEAQAAGRQDADARFDAAVGAARAKAESISATSTIARVRSAVEPRIADLVEAIVDLVLAPPDESEH